MNRYKLTIEYNGTRFAGWQVQPGLRTIQGELQKCLGWVLTTKGEEIKVVGAGRTDAGVHARGQVAHFDADKLKTPTELLHKLNSALPADICVQTIEPVAPDFHARYSALRKTYLYRLINRPSAFAAGLAWRISGELDWPAIEQATAILIGEHDFAGFCLAESQKDDCSCLISSADWIRKEGKIRLEITANRFLHRMVRLIVGTLVAVGHGKLPPDYLSEILKTGDVRLAGQAAPPEGLYLLAVEYA